MINSRTNTVDVIQNVGVPVRPRIPDEIHDLLRWSDWIRAYRATAEFFDRTLAAPGERQQARRISVEEAQKSPVRRLKPGSPLISRPVSEFLEFLQALNR